MKEPLLPTAKQPPYRHLFSLSSWVEGRFRSAERISGQDRYATNFAVLAKFQFDFTNAFFATAENFPDALSGSALAGTGNFPIMLVSKDADSSVFEDLAYNKGLMKMKYILGAEGAVSNSLLDRIFRM